MQDNETTPIADNIFALTVWAVQDDNTIADAAVVEIIFQPDTETFHLILDEKNMLELIERWGAARDRDLRKEAEDNVRQALTA